MKSFDGPVLLTGYGVVAQALLPMLLKHLDVPCRNVTVVDLVNREAILRPWLARGLRFAQQRVTPLNFSRLLSAHVRSGRPLAVPELPVQALTASQGTRKHVRRRTRFPISQQQRGRRRFLLLIQQTNGPTDQQTNRPSPTGGRRARSGE